RPRRQRLAVARARARSRPDRPLRRHQRGHDPRPRRPRAAARRPDAHRRLSGRVERGRDADRRPADRRPRARSRRDRVGRRGALRAARPDRRRGVRRRRPDLLAVQVLRPASRDRLRPPRPARIVAPLQGPAGAGRAGGQALRDRHARLRAARRLRRRRRVRRVAGLGGHHRLGAVAGRALPRRPSAVDQATRAGRNGRPGADVRVLGRRGLRRGGGGKARRARLRRVARQLLRARGDEAPRPRGRRRRRPRRLRALQHGRRGRPAPRGARPAGVSRRSEWAALCALVLISTAFRAWAAVEVPVPWIAPDEMVYGLLGRSLWLHGSLSILGGPTPYYSLLTPLLAGFPLAAFGLGTGYDLLQGLQAFVMSLAAVPVYLWARTLVPRRSALTAAALTLATPVLAYSGLVMTEVL